MDFSKIAVKSNILRLSFVSEERRGDEGLEYIYIYISVYGRADLCCRVTNENIAGTRVIFANLQRSRGEIKNVIVRFSVFVVIFEYTRSVLLLTCEWSNKIYWIRYMTSLGYSDSFLIFKCDVIPGRFSCKLQKNN